MEQDDEANRHAATLSMQGHQMVKDRWSLMMIKEENKKVSESQQEGNDAVWLKDTLNDKHSKWDSHIDTKEVPH